MYELATLDKLSGFNYILTLIFLGVFSFGSCQTTDFVYHHYTTEQGLPSSEVYDVMQTQDGFMWFCTDFGVVRFNGFEFTTFTENDGLAESSILRMQPDQFGRLWFFGFEGTLSYYHNGKFFRYKYNKVLKDHQYVYRYIREIKIGNDGSIEAYSYSRDSFRIDAAGNFEKIFGKPVENSPDHIVLHITDDGVIMHTEHDRVNRINLIDFIHKGKTYGYARKEKKTASATSIENSEYAYYNDRYYVNIGAEIVCLNNGKVTETACKKRVICLYTDGENLWAGMETGGVNLYRWENDSLVLQGNYLDGYSVSRVLRDKDGGLWFTTTTGGIFYVINDGVKEVKYEVLSETPYFIDFKQDNLYACSLKGDIQIWSCPEEKTVKQLSLNTRVHRFSLTNTDLFLYGKNIDRTRLSYSLQLISATPPPSHQMNNSFLDDNYKVCIRKANSPPNKLTYHDRFGNLLFKTKINAYAKEVIPLNDTSLYVITYNKAGILLVTHQEEKILYDKNRISSLCRFNGAFLMATRGGGLVPILGQTIFSITQANGLISNQLTDVTSFDHHTAWVSSNKGLSKIHFDSEYRYEIENYTMADGLASNQIKKVREGKNYLALLSENQLFVLEKEKLTHKGKASLKIASMAVDGKEISNLSNFLQLGSDQNNIEINLTPLCLSCLGAKELKYTLNGVEHKMKGDQLTLSSLKPGNYHLSFYILDSHGNWVQANRELKWEVAAPLWDQIWFQLGLTLICLFVIYFIVQFLLRRRKMRMLEKDRMNHYQNKALLLQMKPHFIFNSLNSIQNKIVTGSKLEAHQYISKFAKLMRTNLEFSDYEYISLQQELSTLDLYLGLEANRIAIDLQWNFDIDASVDVDTTKISPFLLQPIVENSIWHGINHPEIESGQIDIQLRKEGTTLEIRILDNGIGLDRSKERKPKNHNSKSGAIIKKRIALTRSTFEIKDRRHDNEQGTIVTLKIPFIS